MTKVSEIKAEARREEAAGNHRRAIQLYLRALEEGSTAEYATPDPGLSVRIADLNFREGEPGRAIEYYRQAAELYAEQGLITNAIAVCNKILRVFPYEIECYRTMARLHMEVGLVAEARKNLLHYVEMMSERGEARAARVAMRDFLERSHDEEVAARLARSLVDEGLEAEALKALQEVWFRRAERGESNAELAGRIAEMFPGEDPSAWAEQDRQGAGTEEPAAEERSLEVELQELESELPVESEPAEPEAEPDEPELAAELEEPEPEPEETEFEERPEPEEPEPEFEEPEPEFLEPEAEEPEADPDELELAAELEELQTVLDQLDPESDEPEPEFLEPEPESELDEQEFEAQEVEPEPELVTEAESAAEAPPDVQVYQYEVSREAVSEETEPAGTEEPEPEEEWEPGWPDQLELVGQYRELMSEARRLATEFGRKPPAWSAVVESDLAEPGLETGPETSFPEIESGGAMSEQSEDRETTWQSRVGVPETTEPPGRNGSSSGWDPWETHLPEEEEPEEDEAMMEEETVVSGESEVEPAVTDEPEAGPAVAETEMANGRETREPVGELELGEKAELRRGLNLLDELLELTPDNMDLRRRKVSYARRLGDSETLADAYLALAEGLAESGSRRSARLLFEQVVSLQPENEAALAGLARLDALELQEKRRRGGRGEELPAAQPADRQARDELGEKLWTEFEMTIRELPWLHAATQSFQAAGPDRQPAPESFLMMAHYFMARGGYDQAAEVLSAALELTDRSDQEMVDILYYLGVTRQRLGDRVAADELFERVARVDEDFRDALDVLSES
jgi:tetratricopeptide (TPR) repeat protein